MLTSVERETRCVWSSIHRTKGSPTSTAMASVGAGQRVPAWKRKSAVTSDLMKIPARETLAVATSPRITSYNVCYTKLLRTAYFGRPGKEHERHPVAGQSFQAVENGQLGILQAVWVEISYNFV